MFAVHSMALIQSLASLFHFLSCSFVSNSLGLLSVTSKHCLRVGKKTLLRVLCLVFISTAPSFSTCSSLEWCRTCKRLMSIETFRQNANYRQTLHRHFIDKQTSNMHAAGTLQVAGITAAPPLGNLTHL